MKIKTYQEALRFLENQISQRKDQHFPGEIGLKRTKLFLEKIGSPQNKIKVIHVAGTSGKGSTAYLTSLILTSLGLKTGLHVSPHLLDIRERVQIGNKPISKNKFVFYLNGVLKPIESFYTHKLGRLTYFEILTSLAFYVFSEEKVDYAVMETGMGGWHDTTNAVESFNKVCLITKIGFDHIKVLGETLKDIALQKAKIIYKNSLSLACDQKKQIKDVINKVANQQNSQLFWVGKDNTEGVKISPKTTQFTWKFQNQKIDNINLGMIGLYQAENCSLALAAVLLLSKREKFEFNSEVIKSCLKKASFPARLQIFKEPKKMMILDGAHNPQKMASFLESLKILYPGRKFNFLLAFKKGKDHRKMLKLIIPLAEKIYITKFFSANQDLIHLSYSPEVINKSLSKLGFKNTKVLDDSKMALKTAMDGKSDLIITGSLYLIAELYSLLASYVNSGD